MRRSVWAIAIFAGICALAVAGHVALIEIGREVVTLRTQRADGRWQETRLWVVDADGAAWLHSGGRSWLPRFVGNPVVELRRGGVVQRYRAQPVPGPHPQIHALLRAKYGIADRWVRLIAPDDETVCVVRLDAL